ncbi:MAG: polysaccharide biosynthesis/export family protein [Beijerinckiaceae bacterium]
MWRFVPHLITIIVACLAFPAAASDDYKLGSQDKVRLKVYEWRASRGEVYQWVPLNGEFSVGAGGTLSLPFVGELNVGGESVEQTAKVISDRLQKTMGLVDRPSTSVEVVQFRPVYVVGEVATPGEFPFRPGLSVVKVLALSGGLYRRPELGFGDGERESIVSRGDLRVMATERVGLLARRARLEAEAADKDKIDFPAELVAMQAQPDVAGSMREEQLIFSARRNAVRSKIQSLNEAKVLVEREISSLGEKEQGLKSQLTLARRERDSVESLVSRGLTVSARQLSSEQTVAQLESANLDVGIAKLRAGQDRTKLDRDIFDLGDQRRADVLSELRLAEARLAELEQRSVTSQRLVYNAEVLSLRRQISSRRESVVKPMFTIVRNQEGKPIEIQAAEETPLQPGDVLRVERPLSSIYFGDNDTMQDQNGRSVSTGDGRVGMTK